MINPKSQIPNHKQYSNTNNQNPKFGIWNLEFGACLRFGAWCLKFICILVLGAWCFKATPVSAANSGNFTMSLWVNPTTSVASKALISKAEEFRVFTNASGFVGCQIKTTSWQTASQATTKALVLGAWNLVLCSYDLTNLKVYVNGVLVATQALTSVPDDTAAVLRLGQDDSASTTYTNLAGVVDEFKFYNYALSADDVRADYLRGSALMLGSLSNTSALTGGQSASNSASALFCVPGDGSTCSPPVAEWNFEEGTGTSVADTSGNGNTGTWAGTGNHWTQGKIGKAGKFNGTNDYTALPDSSLLEFGTNSFTVNARVKTSMSGYGTVVANDNAHSPPGGGWSMYFYQGKPYFATVDYTNRAVDTINSTSTFNDNNWHLVSGVRDVTSGKLYIYIDGIQAATPVTDHGYNATPATGVYTSIGKYGTYAGWYFSGSLDQVRIFNYARTPAQIAWDYNQGKPIGQWKMNECSGTVIHDSSGNNYTGTLTNATPGTCTTSGTTAWYQGAAGKYNGSLYFDGTDHVAVSNSISTNSIAFWVKPTTNTASMLNLTATQYITAASGTISATNFTSPIYYVNGQLTTTPTLTANVWNHVVVTTATSITANAITIAKANSAYTTGQIDDVRIFNYALTPLQVKSLYNESSSVRFGP